MCIIMFGMGIIAYIMLGIYLVVHIKATNKWLEMMKNGQCLTNKNIGDNMTVQVSKEEAYATKDYLENLYCKPDKPKWLKSIIVDTDTHGWCITMKITSKQDVPAGIQLYPTHGKVKICVMSVG